MTPNRSGQHFTSTQRKANFDHERLYGTTPLALAPRPWQPGGGTAGPPGLFPPGAGMAASGVERQGSPSSTNFFAVARDGRLCVCSNVRGGRSHAARTPPWPRRGYRPRRSGPRAAG